MASDSGPFSQVNSLYGPGNAGGWLLCCITIIITTIFSKRDQNITYDLVVAMVYVAWAAVDATAQTWQTGRLLGSAVPAAEQLINKKLAPMTICATWTWLVVPLLAIGSSRKSCTKPPKDWRMAPYTNRTRSHNTPEPFGSWRQEVFAHWLPTSLSILNASLSAVWFLVAVLGIFFPVANWALPCISRAKTCLLQRVNFTYMETLLLLLIWLPLSVVVVVSVVDSRLGASRTVTGDIRPSFFLWSSTLLLSSYLMIFPALLASELEWVKYWHLDTQCQRENIRSLWTIFSILPKTGVAFSADQIFALMCGFLTLIRGLRDCVKS